MLDEPEAIRRRTMVEWSDADFSVRLGSFADLLKIQHDAETERWNARWSSEATLRNQVEPSGLVIICPLVRNGGLANAPMSYRCYVGYVLKSESRQRVVSVVDVGKERLESLPEASSPDQLKELIRIALEGSPIEPIQ